MDKTAIGLQSLEITPAFDRRKITLKFFIKSKGKKVGWITKDPSKHQWAVMLDYLALEKLMKMKPGTVTEGVIVEGAYDKNLDRALKNAVDMFNKRLTDRSNYKDTKIEIKQNADRILKDYKSKFKSDAGQKQMSANPNVFKIADELMEKKAFNKENPSELFSQLVKVLGRTNTPEMGKILRELKDVSKKVYTELGI